MKACEESLRKGKIQRSEEKVKTQTRTELQEGMLLKA